jgi:hypothetical protein
MATFPADFNLSTIYRDLEKWASLPGKEKTEPASSVRWLYRACGRCLFGEGRLVFYAPVRILPSLKS